MSEPIVVVAGGADQPSADFAAGVATAAAAQASDDAAAAQAEAAAAVAIAGAAAGEAADMSGRVSVAELDAAAAHARVDELEEYVREGFGHISDALVAEAAEHHLGETHDGGGAPEPIGDGSEHGGGEEKPPPSRTGRRRPHSGGAFDHSWFFKGRKGVG
jgi:hypothetical protein